MGRAAAVVDPAEVDSAPSTLVEGRAVIPTAPSSVLSLTGPLGEGASVVAAVIAAGALAVDDGGPEAEEEEEGVDDS